MFSLSSVCFSVTVITLLSSFFLFLFDLKVSALVLSLSLPLSLPLLRHVPFKIKCVSDSVYVCVSMHLFVCVYVLYVVGVLSRMRKLT